MPTILSEVLLSTNSYLSLADKARLKQILEPGFQSEDISTVHYAVSGYKLLGEAVPKADVILFLHLLYMSF